MYELHTDRRGRSSLHWSKYKVWEGYVSTNDLENLFEALRISVTITKDVLDEDVEE